MEMNKVESKSLLRTQKTVTPTDGAPGVDNAIFLGQDRLDETQKEYANAVMVPLTGNVTVVLADGTDHQLPNLIAGIWHNCSPFSQVNSTGTDGNSVVVGVTFSRVNPGA